MKHESESWLKWDLVTKSFVLVTSVIMSNGPKVRNWNFKPDILQTKPNLFSGHITSNLIKSVELTIHPIFVNADLNIDTPFSIIKSKTIARYYRAIWEMAWYLCCFPLFFIEATWEKEEKEPENPRRAHSFEHQFMRCERS